MSNNSTNLDQYISKSTDWRRTLRQNRRTAIVIIMFFAIYIALGLLLDMYLAANMYPMLDMRQLFIGLVTLHIIPAATLVMVLIAFISLAVTYMMYDTLMLAGTNYKEITPNSANTHAETQLYNVIEEIKIAAGLRYMPKVFIIDADYMNAFASGYSEKSAMVAITRGLMEKLDRDELQAVMAHEISHIRHLDIKLTLTASLLANIILMVLDLFFYNAVFGNNNNNNRSRNGLLIIIVVLRYVLPVINVLLLLYLSRTRELMADAGCVELTRANEPLARALLKIQTDYSDNRERYSETLQQIPNENVRREAYIYDPLQAGIMDISSISDLFSTHPSLEVRLKALGFTRQSK